MTESSEASKTVRRTWPAVITVATTIGAMGVHFWAGWIDEHKLVLRPVGPGTVLSFFAWVVALACAIGTLVVTRGHSRLAVGALLVAITGIALLYFA
jgi:hypothetical protein